MCLEERMNCFRYVGVFALFLVGCEPMGASWQLTDSLGLENSAAAEVVEQAESEPVEDDRFPSEEEMERMNDPLGEADGEPQEAEKPPAEEEALAEEESDPAVASAEVTPSSGPDAPPETEEEASLPVQAPETVEPDRVEAAVAGFGAPENPGWGVRLVASIPEAQPPRAVLGLPSGEEVVVSPGSMIPEAAIVVIAVGPGTVVLAEITPEGDHAKVEQRTLHAQYKAGIHHGIGG